MKHTLLSLTMILGVLAGTIIASSSAQADRVYTKKSIKGTYYFLVTETRNEAGQIQHCESHGAANIFPDGRMEICGPTMCNGVPGAPEAGFFNFEFVADDEILLTEVGAPDSTHCKILDLGRIMLCDGGQRTLPELWTWAGTVIKLKSKTDPDLLVSEGCPPAG